MLGTRTGGGAWLTDQRYDGGPTRAFVIPDWDGAQSAVVHVQNRAAVMVYNPRGIDHEKPKRRSSSNWIDELVNWKRKADDIAFS